MHIAEGLLPLGWAAAYAGVAVPFVAGGIRSYVKQSTRVPAIKQVAGALTAAVFIISLLPIPVPFAGTCSHPGGTPLAAILVGPWLATVMGCIALLFQALFLSHGGLTTLGANTLSMGVAGSFVTFLIFRGLRRTGMELGWSAGVAGFVGDLSIYVVSGLEIALAIHGTTPWVKVWEVIMAAYMPTQLPLAVLEGVFTCLVVRYIATRRGDLLERLGLSILKPGEVVAKVVSQQ